MLNVDVISFRPPRKGGFLLGMLDKLFIIFYDLCITKIFVFL